MPCHTCHPLDGAGHDCAKHCSEYVSRLSANTQIKFRLTKIAALQVFFALRVFAWRSLLSLSSSPELSRSTSRKCLEVNMVSERVKAALELA